MALLQPGLAWLEQETGKPVLGVLPYLHGFHLDAEDAISRDTDVEAGENALKVIAPVFPRISNHTDFDPLRLHPQVDFRFIGPGEAVPPADLVILPGTKNVRHDLQWLKDNHWLPALYRHLRLRGQAYRHLWRLPDAGQYHRRPTGHGRAAGQQRRARDYSRWKRNCVRTNNCTGCAGAWRRIMPRSKVTKSTPG